MSSLASLEKIFRVVHRKTFTRYECRFCHFELCTVDRHMEHTPSSKLVAHAATHQQLRLLGVRL